MEQEKREQERQAVSVATNETDSNSPANNQGLLTDHDFERLRADVLNTALIQPHQPQGIPAQGLLPLQHHGSRTDQQPNMVYNTGVRPQFIQRNVSQTQWRANAGMAMHSQQMTTSAIPPTNNNTAEPMTVKKEGFVFLILCLIIYKNKINL